MRQRGRWLVLAAVAAAWAVARQGVSLDLKSTWSATPVKVDGTGDGWLASFVPVGSLPILVSVENDAQYLYLTVRTSDPTSKGQIAYGGLTVWAQAPKAKAGGMGVHFPMHARGQGGGRPPGSREGESRDGGSGNTESSKGPPVNTINDYSTQFALLGPTREDSLIVDREPGQPVQVAIGDDSGVLVYQVRLPLQASDNDPVAVGAAAGTPVTVTLDTTPPKRQAPPEGGDGEGSEGGPPPGGGGRGPGGYGGGMGGYHGSHGGGHWGAGEGRWGVKSFKVDLTVTLAPAPPAAKAAS